MNLSELINEIVSDWAYRVNDGMPNPKNPMHVKELEIVLNEMGLGHVKSEILQSLNEAEEGGFTNPALNKKVRYKNAKGEDKEGIVGNLLRQPEDSPGRKAAEAALPPEGSPERDAMNQELGSEKDGKAKAPEDGKGKEGEDGKEGGADAEAEKKKKAAAMFDPKADPAMGARMDREKAANDKLAQKDKEDSETGQSPSDKAAQDTIKQASDKANDTIKQASDKANAEFKDKADKVAKDKEAAKKKGYNDSLHAMSDDQLDKSLNASIEKQNSLRRSGDNRGADKARIDYAMHKIEKNRRGNPSSEEIDNDFGLKDYKAEYEKSYGEPYDAQIEYPNSDGGKRTPAKWGEAPSGPAAGPNAEPPIDEPSKPDTTPPADTDVPGVNSPNDVELSPKEKYKKAKKEKDDAEKQLSDLAQLKKDHPEQFVTPEKQAAWEKNKEILATKKDEIDALNKQIDADKETKQKETEPIAKELKNRKTADGEDLDIETTDNGSLIIGVEHGEGTESTKQTIEQIQKLPKDAKVMFVGEGGMGKDNDGNIEFGEEQDEIRNAVKGHFDNSEESSWDENANVYDDNSPVYKEIEKELGSPSKARASVWSNMVGQGDDMAADDYLDDEGKQWIIDQAKKAGATNITDKTDFSNLTDAEKKDLYELNFNDEGKMGDSEIMKGQQTYNGFRQKELDRKIKEAEDNGFTVVAPVGNSHVDMWRQRNKPQQKPEQPTDTKPEDKPEDKPATEPTKPEETPKATKDDIKKEKPGKEAKTDSGGSLYSIGGGYYSDKPNGPAKYVRTESVIEMAFDDSLNEDVFALFEKSITGTLQNGEKITVQELPPRAVKKATQRAKAAAASSKEEPAQQPTASAEKPAETPKAQSQAGDFNPINADDVQKEMPKANPQTFGSEPDIPTGIEPKDLEQFNTDIDKVAKEISDAKERGEKAPNINLCDVTVPGTNLYCDDNLGIPRKEMPQFKGKPQPGTPAADMPVDKNGEVDTEPLFKKMLEDKGIKVVQTEVPSDKLKATQSELVGDKVIGMMNALENDPNHPSITAPIYVSRDGYVIDGHHRWAAITAYNAKNPDSQIPMKVQAIDMDIKEAIPMCNDFAEQQGVAAKKADANQESDIQNVTSLPEPKPEDPEEKKNWFQKQKERIQQKMKVMSEAGKQFFGRGGHKPGSVPRRSFGKALVDKIKGIPKAVKDGIVHHAVMFKDAGVAIFEAGAYGGLGTIEDPETGERFNHDDHIAKDENGKKRYEKIPQYETDSHGHIINDPETGKPMQKRHWLTGNLMNEERPIPNEDMSDKQKELFYTSYKKEKKQIKAIVGTGKAIMITAAGAYGLSAAMGHAYTTAGQLMTSTAIELVPHTIAEGVILGTGKAALYAGAVEMNHKKKLEEFSTNLVKTIGEYISSDKEIPADVLANSMELYNNIDKLRENMDKIPDDEGFLKDYVELHDQIEKDGKQKKEMKIESLIREIISEIKLEAKSETFTAIKKDTGKTSVFKSKEARDAAIDNGTHKKVKDDKQIKPTAKKLGAGDFRKTPDMKTPTEKPAKKVKAEPKDSTQSIAKQKEVTSKLYGKGNGPLLQTSTTSQQALDNGYVEGAPWVAPGNAGSNFNENMSNEGVKILEKYPDLDEETLARILYERTKNTKLGLQQKDVSIGSENKIGIPSDIENKEIYRNCVVVARSAQSKSARAQMGADRATQEGKFGKKRNKQVFGGTKEDLAKCEQTIAKAKKIFIYDAETDTVYEMPKDVMLEWVKSSGGGENAADTASITLDENGNAIYDGWSDKKTLKDIQGNSTLVDDYTKSEERLGNLVATGQLDEKTANKAKLLILKDKQAIKDIEAGLKDISIQQSAHFLTLKPNDLNRLGDDAAKSNETKKHFNNFKKSVDDVLSGKAKGGKKTNAILDGIKLLGKKGKLSNGDYFKIMSSVGNAGMLSGDDRKVIERTANSEKAKYKANKKPLPAGLDTDLALSELRKKSLGIQTDTFKNLNKLVGKSSTGKTKKLGDLLAFDDAKGLLHLDKIDTPKDEKDYHQILKRNTQLSMEGIAVSPKTIKECLGVGNTKELEDSFELSFVERYTYDKDNIRVTGKVVYVYAINKDGKKEEIAQKVYRPKQGPTAPTANTVTWSGGMQKCFDSKK